MSTQSITGSASLLTQVVKEFEHDDDDRARAAAQADVLNTGGRSFPCVVFRQGGRLNIVTAFPMSFIARYVRPEPAKKFGDPRSATNRVLMPEHVRSIHDYLKDNHQRYFLPPVTLNVRQIPQIHVARSNAAVRQGYMVIPDETVFSVTDGMHRVAAVGGYDVGNTGRRTPGIIDSLRDELSGDAVAVVIVVEDDIAQIHQDFADAAHTKPIPASLLAAYNTREPVNQVLQEIVERSIFKGRVDETSKTLSKLSNHMFLLNQVRSLLKGLLVGDYAIADASFERRAAQDFADESIRQLFERRTLEFLDILSERMDPWPKIAKTPPSTSASGSLVMHLRPTYLNLTATGLGILGHVAHAINKLNTEGQIDDARRTRLFADLAEKVDWRRDAKIWQSNAVQTGKLVTNRHAVESATREVLKVLGIPVSERGVPPA